MRILVSIAALLLTISIANASVTVEIGKTTGLKTWQWTHEGVSLRLVQRLPDQTRAYLEGKGFPSDQVDELARSCFFGSMFRNDGKQPLDFDLGTWKVVHKGEPGNMRVREYWKERLKAAPVPKAARIALNWSLMPTRQHFEPGDYNWGMTVYGLPPGEHFDLHLKVILGGRPVEAVIPDLQCAPEKIDEPK